MAKPDRPNPAQADRLAAARTRFAAFLNAFRRVFRLI
jgi:hypothetical protein